MFNVLERKFDPVEQNTSRQIVDGVDQSLFSREMKRGGFFAGHLKHLRYDKAIRPEGLIGDPKVGIEVLIAPTRAVASAVDNAAEHVMNKIISTVFRPI